MPADEIFDVLLIGGSGQLGTALLNLQWPALVRVLSPARGDLDITDEAALAREMESRKWSCVVNCAAYTAVDSAESDGEQAWRVNATAARLLGAATAKAATPVVHLSTDYVFDGATQRAYRPQDPVCPINVYGASKAAGEDAIRRTNPRHVIVRTSSIIGPFGNNFVKTVLRRAAQGDPLTIVCDQRSCPTSAMDLAIALRIISLRLIFDPHAPVGTYHFANAGIASWYELALATMQGARRRGAPTTSVEPILAAAYPAKARRPTYSELCTAELKRDFAIDVRDWQTALDEILDVMLLSGRRCSA